MGDGDSVSKVDSILMTLTMSLERLAKETLGDGDQRYLDIKKTLDAVKVQIIED